MKKSIAILIMAVAVITASVGAMPENRTAYAVNNEITVRLESDSENFTGDGFDVIPNDNVSKSVHLGSFEKDSVFSGVFTGNEIKFYGYKGKAGGSVRIYIDDKAAGEFSCADVGDSYKTLIASADGAGEGEHTFRLVTLEENAWVAVDYVEFNVDKDVYNYSFNLAQCASVITSVPYPTGGGSKDLNIIRDESFVPSGIVGGYNSPNLISYDSFCGAGPNVFYMGYEFPFEVYMSKFVFREGAFFTDGGWFAEKPGIEVKINGKWQSVATNSDDYPDDASQGAGFRTFIYTFDTVRADGIRIIGRSGGKGNFVSVSQIEVYGRKDIVSFSEGADYKDRVSFLRHEHEYSSNDEGIKTDASCTTAGYIEKRCVICGLNIKTETEKPKGHDMETKITEPTCTEKGYTVHKCSVCGYTVKDSETQAKGHSYETTVTEPTCAEKGYTTHKCTACGDEYTDGETPAKGHSWNDGEVTKQPTTEEEGEKTFTCTECGTTKTEVVAKLEKEEKPSGGSCTGKTSSGADAAIALTVLAALAIVLRRKK